MLDRVLCVCAVLVAVAWLHELRARRVLLADLDRERALVVELRNVVALAPYAHRRAIRKRPAVIPLQRGRDVRA